MAERQCSIIKTMNTLKKLFSKELPFFLTLPAIVWQILFIVLPLLIIGYFSISTVDATNWWPRLTIQHYISLIDWVYFRIMLRSLILAGGTAATCLVLAYPLAYYLALHVQRYKNVLLFLLTLPFWVNFLVQIYAWYFLLEHNGLINKLLQWIGIINEPLMLANSQFAIFIVMIYCYLPFMIMPLYNMLEKIDKRLLEASADLGASTWQTFVRVTLPLSLPGIKTGVLLVLIPAFGEFVIPSLLGGSKYMMVGSLISYFFLVARNNQLGSAFTVLSGLLLIGVIFCMYAVGKLYARKQLKALT